MRVRFTVLVAATFVVLANYAQADDCVGTSDDAVMTLPTPLNMWGQLVCTPYGHVIVAHQGWIWTRPGSYSPVWIPAQMVQQNPKPLGNQSYFTKITLTKIDEAELQIPYGAFHSIFPGEGPPPGGYRLDVSSNSGRTLRLYFLEYAKAPWGIWCKEEQCDPQSIFMILDMSKSPGGELEKPN